MVTQVNECRPVGARLVCLETGPLLDRKIRQIRTLLEHSRNAYGRMVLHSFRDAIADVFPAREPFDRLAFGLRLTGDDRPLEGGLVSPGRARTLGGPRHHGSDANESHSNEKT